MFLRLSRCYSSSAAPKSNLAVLRKSTGFPISKCKEALDNNSNDLESAEKWLYSRAQAEGWAQLEKLRERTAKQGLIGLLIRGNRGAMVEVNCETDFVAKNEKFQSLVSVVTHALFDHQPEEKSSESPSPLLFTQEQLSRLKASQTANSGSVGDMVAGSVGVLGENLILRRACLLTSSLGGILCGNVYNNLLPISTDVALGKYAAVLHLSPTEGDFGSDVEAVTSLGNTIGQHIIGLDPLVVNEGDSGVTDPTKVLTKQGFLLDEEVNVGDMLTKCNSTVTHFVRYALGET